MTREIASGDSIVHGRHLPLPGFDFALVRRRDRRFGRESGSVMAALLAEAGLSVIVLEEGPYYRPGDYQKFKPSESVRRLFREAGMFTAFGVGQTPIVTITVRARTSAARASSPAGSASGFRAPSTIAGSRTSASTEALRARARVLVRRGRAPHPRRRGAGLDALARHDEVRRGRDQARDRDEAAPAQHRPRMRGQRALQLLLPGRRQALGRRRLPAFRGRARCASGSSATRSSSRSTSRAAAPPASRGACSAEPWARPRTASRSARRSSSPRAAPSTRRSCCSAPASAEGRRSSARTSPCIRRCASSPASTSAS